MIGVHIEAGLSNRIFKMIFAYTLSKKYNIAYRFENWDKHSHHTQQVYDVLIERFQNQTLYIKEPIIYQHQWNEPGDEFVNFLDVATLVPEIFTKNVFIHGFFQNEKYFKEYRHEILELLREPESITTYIYNKYKDIIPFIENSYFLHVRLGDYLQLPKHWIDLENYYSKCLKNVAKDNNLNSIVIFSNQVSFISRFYPKLQKDIESAGLKYIIIDEPDELVCFYLMVRCKLGGICSNSTYGWWASWLNTNANKKVYMPSKWINMEIKNDIYPDYAIVIDV